jgi:peptidoglycan/LPS O-acetylase OafA/YrhL
MDGPDLPQPETAERETRPPDRYPSLDGLRGMAALIVVLCHTFIVQPALMQAYLDPSLIQRGTRAWWVTFSPLHLAWAGQEMVYLFFVLSGFVLALPFSQPRQRRWAGYYPKRFLRLYPPVWAAFPLAAFWMFAFRRHFSAIDSAWLQVHPTVLQKAAIRGDLTLIPGPLGTNSVLWTLRFEVIFSILLPLLVLVGRKYPKLDLLKAALICTAVVAFANSGPTLRFYLPMFLLGVLLAMRRASLAKIGRKVRNLEHARVAWWGLAIFTLALVNSYWTLWGITTDPGTLSRLIPLARLLMLAGGCMAVFMAIESPFCRWFEKPPVKWLGKRSFSLYLVHEPIIVAVAVVLGGHPGPLLAPVVILPVAFCVAEVFYRLVERPSKRLGQRVEARIQDWRAARAVPIGGDGSSLTSVLPAIVVAKE